MSDSKRQRIHEELTMNWEEALNRYERIMASGAEAMRVKATVKLAQLSNITPESVLARTIPILANVLGSNASNNFSSSVQGVAAYCLKCIACEGEGRLAVQIGESGALDSILRLLPQSDDSFQRVLVKCLRYVAIFGEGNPLIVARNGGLEIIVNMLNSAEDSTRRYLLEILAALSLMREVRRELVSLRGLRFLVEAACFGSMISRSRACQAIGSLGVTKQGRRMLVELGVLPVLVELFRTADGSTKLVAANSLGIISAHTEYIRPAAQAGAIPLYVELLQGPESVGKEIAKDVLPILAVAEENAVVIAENLVRVLREGDVESKAAAAEVFWDLSGYEHSVPVVRNSGAIPILVELLRDRNGEAREEVSSAISRLSYSEEDRVALGECGAVAILIEMFHDQSEELRVYAAQALINFYEDPLYQEQMTEANCISLFEGMNNRLNRIRPANEQMTTSMRRISIEQLTWDHDI